MGLRVTCAELPIIVETTIQKGFKRLGYFVSGYPYTFIIAS
jgi:hypothetical protein